MEDKFLKIKSKEIVLKIKNFLDNKSFKSISNIGIIKEIGSHTFKIVEKFTFEGPQLTYILLGVDILVSKWKLVIEIKSGNVLIIDSDDINKYEVFINSNYFKLVNSAIRY